MRRFLLPAAVGVIGFAAIFYGLTLGFAGSGDSSGVAGTPTPNPSCPVAGSLNISTGTAGIGNLDPLWTVNGGAAYGIAALATSWAVPPAGKNPHWIGATLASNVFETSFNVPAGVASLTLAFEFAADNNVSIVLTGPPPFLPSQISPVLSGILSNNFSKLHPATPTSITMPSGKLPAGKYKLTATVGNQPGTVSGLLVVGNVTCVASPPTPTLTATATPSLVCDLAIRKTMSPNPVQSGQPLTISLTVTNVGTGPCQGVTAHFPGYRFLLSRREAAHGTVR